MNVVDGKHHILSFRNCEAIRKGVFSKSAAQQHRGVGVEAHALIDTPHRVLEFLILLHVGRARVSQHSIHLFLHTVLAVSGEQGSIMDGYLRPCYICLLDSALSLQ